MTSTLIAYSLSAQTGCHSLKSLTSFISQPQWRFPHTHPEPGTVERYILLLRSVSASTLTSTDFSGVPSSSVNPAPCNGCRPS